MLSWWLRHHKESACSAGDPGLILRLGRSPGERNGYLFQYSCLDRGACRATIFLPEECHGQKSMTGWQSMGSQKSWTWLRDFHTSTIKKTQDKQTKVQHNWEFGGREKTIHRMVEVDYKSCIWLGTCIQNTRI